MPFTDNIKNYFFFVCENHLKWRPVFIVASSLWAIGDFTFMRSTDTSAEYLSSNNLPKKYKTAIDNNISQKVVVNVIVLREMEWKEIENRLRE